MSDRDRRTWQPYRNETHQLLTETSLERISTIAFHLAALPKRNADPAPADRIQVHIGPATEPITVGTARGPGIDRPGVRRTLAGGCPRPRRMSDFLIYGATGYTGELVAREAARRACALSWPPAAARRWPRLPGSYAWNTARSRWTRPTPSPPGFGASGSSSTSPGPSSHTARPLTDACLKSGSHYLDITGEAALLEAQAARAGRHGRPGWCCCPASGSTWSRPTAWPLT